MNQKFKIKTLPSGIYEYKSSKAIYQVMVKNKEIRLDSIMCYITIKNIKEPNNQIGFSVNLAEGLQVRKQCEKSQGYVKLDIDDMMSDINQLTPRLLEVLEKEKAPTKPEDFIINKKEGEKLLKSKNFITEVQKALKMKIVGESNLSLLMFFIAVSYKYKDTLNGLINASSSSGKTHILKTITSLLPPEDVVSMLVITKNALQNLVNNEMVGKCFLFEDYSSITEDNRMKIRELQTNKSIGVAKHDQTLGHAKISPIKAHFSTLAASTSNNIKIDNLNRCFIQTLDEEKDQTEQIIKHQSKIASGEINFDEFKKLQTNIQDSIRLLQPVEVVNPFASMISFPSECKDPRRLYELLLGLINVIAFIQQHSREKDELGRVIVAIEDLELAIDLTLDMFVLKSDDIDNKKRLFFQELKKYLETKKGKDESITDITFKIKELYEPMEALVRKSSVHTRVKELQSIGFIKYLGGNQRVGEKFCLAFDDEYEQRKEKIKTHFLNLIQKQKAA